MSEQDIKTYDIQPPDIRKAAEFLRSRSSLSKKIFFGDSNHRLFPLRRIDEGEMPPECCALGALGLILKQDYFPSIEIDTILYELLKVVDRRFFRYLEARGVQPTESLTAMNDRIGDKEKLAEILEDFADYLEARSLSIPMRE